MEHRSKDIPLQHYPDGTPSVMRKPTQYTRNFTSIARAMYWCS